MKATINKQDFDITKIIFGEGFADKLQPNEFGVPSLTEKGLTFILLLKDEETPKFEAVKRFLNDWLTTSNPKEIILKENGIRLNAKGCTMEKRYFSVLGLCEVRIMSQHCSVVIKNQKSVRNEYSD
jgi:hypothetical protein